MGLCLSPGTCLWNAPLCLSRGAREWPILRMAAVLARGVKNLPHAVHGDIKMAHTTDMNTTTPMPTTKSFRLQMEGMATAMLYAVCFGWIHLGSGSELVNTKVLAVFLVGLIVVPLLTALPMLMVRRLLIGGLQKQPSVAAFSPFASFALYALQGILVWVATREAYAWVFGGAA